MKNILSKQQAAILAALLIVLIAAIPVGFKTWFVAESGNMKIMPGIGPLVALGLVMRWRWGFPLGKSVIRYQYGVCCCAFPYQCRLQARVPVIAAAERAPAVTPVYARPECKPLEGYAITWHSPPEFILPRFFQHHVQR
ncbi:MAG: hypothetical protein IPK76_20300 [Lewinellaceae bacterium]|nr:hypothetical protein [Lewinellaceae bacterium]